MDSKNSNSEKFTSIRVYSESHRKLTALRGMDNKTIADIVQDMVDKRFKERIEQVSENPDSF